jgi:hypothetical protein
MKCPNCGRQPISASDTFCQYCGVSLAPSSSGVLLERGTAPAAPAADPIQHYGKSPAPVAEDDRREPPFRLAYDEAILKRYEAVVLRTAITRRIRGRGTLYVTDARVVFHATINPKGTTRASKLIQQTKLEHISGLSVSVQRSLSPLLVLLTSLFVLTFLGGLLEHNHDATVLPLILAIGSGILLAVDARNRGKVAVTIKSKSIDNSPIGFGYGARLGHRSAYDLLRGKPGKDADILIKDLGALILDVQTRGTTAYEYWGITGARDRGQVTTAL